MVDEKTEMNDPLVTVLMSVYNGEKHLAGAIESILNQTFKDFEFLIVNDGSTDSSRNIILSYNDSRMQLIDNATNIGLTRSLNKGLELARGTYIARMDADDISLPARFEKQIAFMESNKDVAVCGTCGFYIDHHGILRGDIQMNLNYDDIYSNIFLKNQLMHGSVIFNRKVIQSLGMYDETYTNAQDYELWLRVLMNGYKIHNINDRVYYYRINETMNFSEMQEDFACRALKKILDIYLKYPVNLETIVLFRKLLKNERIGYYNKIVLLLFIFRLKRKFVRYLNYLGIATVPDCRYAILAGFDSSIKKIL